jgi:DNA-binding Xre family transcriptional regulator
MMKLRERFYYFFHAEEIKAMLENQMKTKKEARWFSAKSIRQRDRNTRFARAMMQKDISQKEIAEKLGVDPSLVCRAMWGEKKSARIERGICEILEIDIRDVA